MTKPNLNFLFNPRSIALAGASPDISHPNLAQGFVRALQDSGFKGAIYPLHPAGGEIYGKKIYKNVKDIEGPVDYVVSAIPARLTPQLISDCVEKRVKAIHLFTSGYSEIEDEIGKHLESEILAIARKGGVRLIGPNCMGIYCPSSGMTFAAEFPDQKPFPKQCGPLGLISQSGGNAIYFIRQCVERGVFFSKVVSYGNAADIDEADYLEIMADDPDTELIAMYVEGVKDGGRLRKVLARTLESKPVIVNKVGNTETGARTAASHTSAIAGESGIWHAFLKQTGAMQVNGMDELADAVVTFSKLPVPKGRNVVVIGTGGGVGVQAADDISNAGLRLPMLPVEVRKRLREIYGTEAGSFFRNPVDSPPFRNVDDMATAVRAIAASQHIDIIILHFGFDIWAMISRSVPLYAFVESVNRLAGSLEKPLAIVLHYSEDPKSHILQDEVRAKFVALGLPVYPSIGRAARAISRYIDFYEHHERTVIR